MATRRAPLLGALLSIVVCIFTVCPARADGTGDRLDALERRADEQAKENAALRSELAELKARGAAPPTATAAAEEGGAGTGSLPEKAAKERERLGSYGGVYAKPFLTRLVNRAYLGGYMDVDFQVEQGRDKTFQLPRFIPFIYADVTEQLKVAAEIEFEFGGISDETDGEVKLEFAFTDYIFTEALAFRAGAVLVPIGKFNENHDSPINELTSRPLVDLFVIPTTFTEVGAGFYGSIYPFGEAKVDYEVYLLNGFRGLVKDPDSPTGFSSKFNTDEGPRDARPDFEQNINNSLSGAGRLAFSPFLGLETGVSAHLGNYDEHAGGLFAALYALDATVQFGRFAKALQGLNLLGEVARMDFQRNDVARASGVPEELWGGYVQADYHFMPEALQKALPIPFGPESTFALVARYDHLDLDGNRSNRLTPGLNFRPTQDTVFRVDYAFQFEDWSRRRIDNDVFSISFATYF